MFVVFEKMKFIALTIIFCNGMTYSYDYCSISRDNTMCKYPSATPSQKCTGLLISQLTREDEDHILKLHNDFRELVASGGIKPQPAAKEMPNLTWDDEIATVAQRWASQCDYGHDANRNVERFSVGQNIAITWNTDPNDRNLTKHVEFWMKEVKDYNPNDLASYNSQAKPVIGHYTQMVWAETTKLGCGMTKYIDRKNYPNFTMYAIYLVCDYGPAGNIYGQPVYVPK